MPITQIGLVYYADDAEKKVFRKIYPTGDDSELDDPQWTTVAVDKDRTAILVKVLKDSPEALQEMTGTP